MKKALITGITGQDGAYLAEFLLQKGYEVHGCPKGCENTCLASAFLEIFLQTLCRIKHVVFRQRGVKPHPEGLAHDGVRSVQLRSHAMSHAFKAGLTGHVARKKQARTYTPGVEVLQQLFPVISLVEGEQIAKPWKEHWAAQGLRPILSLPSFAATMTARTP